RKTIVLITNDVDEALLLADRIVPLTPGPSATFGPEFKVAIPRPRDRSALNDDVEFRRLRAAVTRYLLDANRSKASRESSRTLPNVLPMPVKDPPKAYLKATPKYEGSRYVEFY